MKLGLFALLLGSMLISCKNDKKVSAPAVITEYSAPALDQVPVTNIKLTKVWQSDSTLMTAESVLFDERQGLYYVSCIGNVPPNKEDGDGYIATLDQRGNILNATWLKGLDAPKGMVLNDGKLYVADINDLVIIDQATAQIIKRINVPGATFLNDVALAPDGKVYFTDSDQNTIYVYADEKVKLFKKDNGLGGTNGIFVDDETIYLAGFGNGDINTIDLASKEITNRAKAAVPGGDGIAPWEGGFVYSNWNGEVYYITANWEAKKILDTKASKANAADITINPKNGELLVPTFFDNRVVAYKIESVR
ncbi:MAG: outer membrane protein assembly factor BamB [Saprospiraceae bacterium]|jgi:outer membrane protein assembly factor BamB|tara:strand:+ start:236 stop:1156 length:921 start_codon:yes stop_codon:yes gene_type:complete